MQLDDTSIAIRERSYLDILDLALKVFRAHPWPLLLTLAAGILPMMLLNTWLLADYTEGDLAVTVPTYSLVVEFFGYLGRMRHYLFYGTLLVAWEMPLAGAAATVYLGEILFNRQPSWRRIFRGLWRSLPQLFIYQVFFRGLLIPLILFTSSEMATLAFLGLMVFWPYLFIARPYLNEVILLEQNPLRAGGRDRMTTARRSKVLHAGQSGDMMARWLAASAVGMVLLLAFWFAFGILRGLLLGQPQFGPELFTVYYQLVLWIVVGYSTVVRFLSYLDLRIRREGWEVELSMRAERARLTEQLA